MVQPLFKTNQQKKAEKPAYDQPFYLDVIDFILRPNRAITGAVSAVTDKDPNTTFLGGLKGGITGQEKIGFNQILNNLGWEQNTRAQGYNFLKGQKGKFDLFDIATFGGDVVTDPLTYLTAGVGGAVKAGVTAMTKQAARNAATAGVKVSSRAWRTVPQAIYKKVYNDELARGASSTSADAVANRAKQAAQRDIDDAGKNARRIAQNDTIQFNIPFTNKVVSARQIADKVGAGNLFTKPKFLRLEDAKAGTFGAAGLTKMLDDIGVSRTIQDAMVRSIYGVTKKEDLTGQMVDDFVKRINVRKDTGNFPPMTKFVQDMGGTSAIGRKLGKMNVFNARTLRSDNPFVNKAAVDITKAINKTAGRRKLLARRVNDLGKVVDGFTDEELRAITYLIENAFPGGISRTAYLASLPDAAKVLRVMPEFQQILKEITEEEIRSGVLKNTRLDYFPHVFTNKANIERIKNLRAKYALDPDIGIFVGRSSLSRFSKTRSSFKNFAELEDKINDLIRQRSLATNPADIATLDEKIDILQNLFERTPVEALGKRYYASIRAVAMKDLQNNLADSGLLVYADDLAKATPEQVAAFVRIDESLSNQLGIPKNSIIHEEVLQGIQNVNYMFTDDGLQKFVNTAQSVTNIFKTLTTSFLPSHYFFNFVGNTATNMMVGVSMKNYKEAVRILNGYRKGTLTPEEMKLVEFSFDNGILGQTSSADLRILAEDPRTTALRKVDDILQKAASPFRENLGDAPDHMFRLAHLLRVLDRTNSYELAAESVRKHLFNYNELTATDKIVKVIFPFWNWTKNNLPLQIHKLMTQPRYAVTYERIRNQTLGDVKEDENAPAWLKEAYAKVGKNEFYNPRLPVADLATPSDPMKLMGMLTPFAKIPIELTMNKQFFGGKPIDYNRARQGGYDPEELGKYLARQTGLSARVYQAYGSLLGEKKAEKSIPEDIRDLLIGKTTSLRNDEKKLPEGTLFKR